jgi:hypothetical protein
MSVNSYVELVFDCPPGPRPPQLIEVVDHAGKSVDAGKWIKRPDNRWALRMDSARVHDVLTLLYENDITCSLSSDRDGGWHATIGNQPGGGCVAEAWVASLDEAVTWLQQQAHLRFPQSDYARRDSL